MGSIITESQKKVSRSPGGIDWPLYIGLAVLTGILAYTSLRRQIGNTTSETDFYWSFLWQAQDLLLGVFPRYGNKQPLYSAVLAVMYSIVGDWFRSGQIISITCGVINVWLFAKLARYLAGGCRWAGWVVAFLVAANYYHFRFSYEASRDPLLFMLSTGAIYLLLTGKGARGYWGCAVLGSLATLTRLNGLVLAPTLAVYAFFAEGFNVGRTIRRAALPALLICMTLVAWVGVKYVATGSPALMSRDAVRHAVSAPKHDAQLSTDSEEASDSMAATFVSSISRRGWRRLQLDARSVLGYPLLALVSAGFILSAARRKWPFKKSDTAALLTFDACSFLMLSMFHYEHRYSLPYVFLLPMLGVLLLRDAAKSRSLIWRVPVAMAIAAVITAAVVKTSKEVRTALSTDPVYLLDFARYLREEVNNPATMVVAFKPHIAVYGNVQWQRVRARNSVEELLEGCNEVGADYLLFTHDELRFYNHSWFLFEHWTDIDQLVPVFSTGNGTLYKYVADPRSENDDGNFDEITNP